MKRPAVNVIFVALFILFTGFIITKSFFTAYLNCTGSPGDYYQTCVSCHWGTLTDVSGYFETDIPPEGFIPGDTYKITFNLPREWGTIPDYEITGENSNAVKMGWFSAISTTGWYTESYDQKNLAGCWLSDTVQEVRWVAPSDTSCIHIRFYSSINYGMMESRLCTLGAWQAPLDIKDVSGSKANSFIYDPIRKLLVFQPEIAFYTYRFYSLTGQCLFSAKPVNGMIWIPDNVQSGVILFFAPESPAVSGSILYM